jgi:hypothetical protein
MKFSIRMGIPEMSELWNDLTTRAQSNGLSAEERWHYKKLGKAFYLLANNPRHNSLESHEIAPLTERYGLKVFQSYLENKTPAAGRFFWVYGPDKAEITIIGIEPHPEDKKSKGYDRIKLSGLPKQ